MLISCSVEPALELNTDNSAVTASIPTASPVVLQTATATCSYYHGMGSTYRSYTIQVKNLAFEKYVAIVQKMADGTWEEYPAEFSRTIDNGYEIWAVSLSDHNNIWAEQFAVKYTVNGVTYWDNNGGKDYAMAVLDGTWLNPAIKVKTAYKYLYHDSYTNLNYFGGSVDVQNLSYNKKVDIIYTTDGWQTTQVIPGKYYGTYYMVGYSQYVNNPNRHGIERWGFSTYVGAAQSVEFAVSYTVNGLTYWDNNYGENHSVSINQ